MKVGDFVQIVPNRTMDPCYGIIIGRKELVCTGGISSVWVVHWNSDTSYGYPRADTAWEADLEVVSEGR